MNTVTKLQVVCFFAGLVGGYSYGQGEYVLATIAGMTAAISLALIYSFIRRP